MFTMLTPALLAWVALILLVEAGMWLLFHRGVVRICIPADLAVLRKPRVSMAMLHVFAFLHTALLLFAVIAAHFFLW